MFKQFKEFIMRGNVLDLAIGIIIGGAFGKIVSSLVSDVIMPPIGLLLNGINFTDLVIPLKKSEFTTLAEYQAAGIPTINIGLFIEAIIDFLIIALVVFLIIKGITRLTKKPAKPADPTTKECPHCCTNIAIKATRCPNCTSQLNG